MCLASICALDAARHAVCGHGGRIAMDTVGMVKGSVEPACFAFAINSPPVPAYQRSVHVWLPLLPSACLLCRPACWIAIRQIIPAVNKLTYPEASVSLSSGFPRNGTFPQCARHAGTNRGIPGHPRPAGQAAAEQRVAMTIWRAVKRAV